MAAQLASFWKKYFSSISLLVRVAVAVGLVFFFMLAERGDIPVRFFQQLELQAYDARLLATMPNKPDPRVVIIDIDEKSLQAEGRFPWPRDKVAFMTQQLFEKYDIKALGFDIIFSEADESSGLLTLEKLAKNEFKDDSSFQGLLPRFRKDLDYDQKFADVLKKYNTVLAFAGGGNIEASTNVKIGELPRPTYPPGTFAKFDILAKTLVAYSANLKLLQDNAPATGHIIPDVDGDGVIRRVPMLVNFKDGYYESLAMATFRSARDNAPVKAQPVQALGGPLRLGSLEVGGAHIPLDPFTAALVPYRGPSPMFRYISATDVIQGRLAPGELKDKIGLVGTSAQGLFDLRNTPVGEIYPGVEVHANLISGFLDNRIKTRSADNEALSLVTMFVVGILLAFLLPKLSPIMATVVTIGVSLLLIANNLYQWESNNTVYSIALPVLMVVVLYVFNMAYGFFIEARSKQAIVSRFGEYVPRELVKEMAQNPQVYSMAGESREMTVLFSDVRDFTTISESLAPESLSKMMNNYLTPMTEVVQSQRGTIDKYIGDAIMAFWGAPLPDDKHAEHGLRSALEMQKRIRQLDAEFKTNGWPPLNIGVGVNCGKMSVGNMGSTFRRAYTVMGDAVNLAARMEGLTKEYGIGIMVSENMVKQAPIAVYRELDRVRVKGKLEPISIYEPVGIIGEVPQQTIDEVERFHKVLARFRSQEWDEAEKLLQSLHHGDPDRKLYKVYLERIEYYRANPPGPDWDTVFTFKTK